MEDFTNSMNKQYNDSFMKIDLAFRRMIERLLEIEIQELSRNHSPEKFVIGSFRRSP